MGSERVWSRGIPLVVVATVLLTLLLLWTRPQPESVLQPDVPAVVEVAQVVKRDFAPVYTVTGRLQPARKAGLRAEVSGRVTERLVEAGQRVGTGDALLRLDDGDYSDALREAEARLQQEAEALKRDRRLLSLAVSNRESQARESARLDELGVKSMASKSAIEKASQRLFELHGEEARLHYSVNTADARLALREADAARARRNLARTRILAPFAGTVNAVYVDVGDYVQVSALVVELVESSQLDLYLELPGATAAGLALGAAVEVQVGRQLVNGRIIALQRDPNADTLTHPARIRIAGDGLTPGLLATAKLPLPPLSDVLAIPVAAILNEEGTAYVFVVAEGQLQRRVVVPGVRHGDLRVIHEGLSVNETIVVRDVAALSDGLTVKVAATSP